MVIKTDELPAAAPADSAREPSSQAGGKGRPGAAGEQGWGQGAAGREAGLGRAGGWVRRCAGTAAFLPRLAGLHLAGPCTGCPCPEGHLHCRPRLRPGLRTWGPGENSGGEHTRDSPRGHVRAHAVSGCAAEAGGPTRRPHPLRAWAWGTLPAGVT